MLASTIPIIESILNSGFTEYFLIPIFCISIIIIAFVIIWDIVRPGSWR